MERACWSVYWCLAALLVRTTEGDGLLSPEPDHSSVAEGHLGIQYQWPEQQQIPQIAQVTQQDCVEEGSYVEIMIAESKRSASSRQQDFGEGHSFLREGRRFLPGWEWEKHKENDGGAEPDEPGTLVENVSAAAGGVGLTDTEALRVQESEKHRDLLNALVAESVRKTDAQACNLAFVKTHKTASTTLAMIFVRYARRHDKKLASFEGNFLSVIPLQLAVEQVQDSGQRVDVMHYHVNNGAWVGDWEDGLKMYRQIMQVAEPINFITVVRSPREHFLSYYYYYMQPTHKLSIGQYLQRTKMHPANKLTNPMCLEFGVTTSEQLDSFIDKHLPDFLLVILTEQFDEGLMMLRRLMGWDMIDVTYSVMMETKKGAKRWDDKVLVDVPAFDSLRQWVQDAIDVNTALDRRLYEAAVRIFKQKAADAGAIDADVVKFKELQRIVGTYLEGNASSDARRWYASDAEPYKGGPPLYPF
ncbi:unnamed protein product [Pylaiella littoralis]